MAKNVPFGGLRAWHGVPLVCAALLCGIALCSCAKEHAVQFDTSDPLALVPGLDWAVVTAPYAAYREQPGYDEEVCAHARQGDVMQVLGKRLQKDSATSRTVEWYSFEQGWIDGPSLTLYDNKLKAQTAARELVP